MTAPVPTPEQRKLLIQAQLAKRELARRSLLQFTKQTLPSYTSGWVHDDIAKRLERFSKAVAERKSPRLMLLAPPRSGKSELASIRFPAWHLGHYPNHEIINAGYNMDLPMIFSRKVRELLRNSTYQGIFPTRLDPNTQAVEAWMTTSAGGLVAAGVGSGITGKGASVFIIDDPIKNAEEADSPDRRDLIQSWYESAAYTRLAPGGGVLLIQCMTGDTKVLMADGSELNLEDVRRGDEVATFDDGQLSKSVVTGWKNCGSDSIYKITMTSGKIVRANGRHPFLVSINGELRWVRTQNLTTAHTIVALKGPMVNGAESSVLNQGAARMLSAVGYVTSTTRNVSGPTATERPRTTLSPLGSGTSNTGTGSPPSSSEISSLGRKAGARYAKRYRPRPATGLQDCVSTTTMGLEPYGGCSATTVTSPSGMQEPSEWPSQWRSIYDFTTDRVLSVEPAGTEDVYDLSVERTQNFIANGLVSHNTSWSDDDLAGRLQAKMRLGGDNDQFEIVKYPALAENFEYRIWPSMEIIRTDTLTPYDEIHHMSSTQSAETIERVELLRSPGDALHPERYDSDALRRIKANVDPRVWSALYQQNPVPDEGMFFNKDQFREIPTKPDARHMRIVTAWDFAIGEKQVNDWTVGTTVAQDHNDVLYVLEVVRFKGDSFRITEEILDVAKRWSGMYGSDYSVGVEDGQLWKAFKPLIDKRMAERKEYPSIEVMKPLSDKTARARPLQGRMQQGRVLFPADASWYPVMRQEMLRFPAGVHDDQVDSLAWAARMVMGRSPPPHELDRGRPKDRSWRDQLDLTDNTGVSWLSA